MNHGEDVSEMWENKIKSHSCVAAGDWLGVRKGCSLVELE
jgi:hypothetical protein